MTASYGAHEVLELHEVLTDAINGINTMQLYRPHVKDQQLASMLDKQMQFAIQEYNTLVQSVSGKGLQAAVPYRAPKTMTPTYGLHQPGPHTPNMSAAEIDDRDVASAALSMHKTGATRKMMASLECADSQLRHILQQGAVNCGEQAFEVWQYMNQHGYYQVPTMKEMTTQTMLNAYQPASTTGMHGYSAGYQTAGYASPSTIVSQVTQPAFGQTTQPGATAQGMAGTTQGGMAGTAHTGLTSQTAGTHDSTYRHTT